MQHRGKTVEIGYSCFAMNIKGGRGFPGISLYNPIKRSGCLIRITTKTNEKQLGRGHCVVVGSRGVGLGGYWVQECGRMLRVRGRETWLSEGMNRVKLNDSFVRWGYRSNCAIVNKWVKRWIIMSLIQTALQASSVLSDSVVISTGRAHLVSFLFCCSFFFSLSLFWQDEVRQSSSLSLASSPSLSDSFLVEDNTL